MNKKLTIKQEKFACEFVETGNASESYRKAYDISRMSAKSIGRKSCELKSNPLAAARIKELHEAALERAEIKVSEVLKIWIKIAMADPNELVQLRRVACPECHNEADEPCQNCDLCKSLGIEQVYIADTRYLSDSAKLLYGGVRRTKYGVEIILRNQDAALENIAKFLGMYQEKQQNKELPKADIRISKMTHDPTEASRIYRELMG
jgi:phage terminase small subunit